MEFLASEPDNALGHDHPGTIRQIDEDNGKFFIIILCNNPLKLSNPIEVTKKDIDTIARHWEQNKRVSITKKKAEKSVFTAEKGYKILPNMEVWPDKPNLDITI
jgi:hypothetical protein